MQPHKIIKTKRLLLFLFITGLLFFSCKDDFMQEYKDKNIIHFNVEIREQEHTKGTPINSASDDLFTEFGLFARSAERRVGNECLRLCRSQWSPYH